MRLITVVIVLLCGSGFASAMSPTAAAWLSHVFAWLFVAVGGAGGLWWLGWELWHAAEDWRVLGPPDLAPLRRRLSRREPDREEAREK